MLLLRKIHIAIALFLICGAQFATAADSGPLPTAQNSGTELVTLNMRDADIRAVIQWIAEQTHKQIVIDPRVQGRVTALADHPITLAQAYQVFLALLEVHGYSTSETDGVMRIYPAALAKISPKAVVDDFNSYAEGGQVMHVTDIKNVSAGALVELIKPLVSPAGYIAPLPASNSLVLADDSSNVKRLLDLIQRMDRTGSLEIDVVKLQHASARDTAKLLETLAKPAGGGAEGAATPLSIAADERSNSVLLAGDPVNRQRARQLIVQLDQPLDATAASRVIFLHYMSATEILPILKNITASAQKEAKDQTVKEASLSIEASQSSNALVMSGPPDLLDSMQDVIAKLDVQRAQVLVEAVIVELDQDLADKLGVEWSTDFSSSGFQAGTSFGLRPQTTNGATSTDLLSSLSSGLTLGYYQGGTLRALLNALSSNTSANILSTPSIMTLDNQQAQIVVGSNIPVITGQATSSGSSTDNPFTTFERKDIGVTLKITPLVNNGKSVTLDIVQDVQTLADSAGFKDTVTNKRTITTKVLVQNGRTIVLGGLISNQNQQTVNKVPILGDMPLIGKLFSSTSSTFKKQNLMVFIHPVIIDSAALAHDISQTKYEDMRVQQLKYQDGKIEDTNKTALLPEFETMSPQQSVPAPTPQAESPVEPQTKQP
jgi:general secretion pathway protein D